MIRSNILSKRRSMDLDSGGASEAAGRRDQGWRKSVP